MVPIPIVFPQLDGLQFDSVQTSTCPEDGMGKYSCRKKGQQIPQAKGSVLQDCPPSTSDASHKSRLSPVLLINQKFQQPPLWV